MLQHLEVPLPQALQPATTTTIERICPLTLLGGKCLLELHTCRARRVLCLPHGLTPGQLGRRTRRGVALGEPQPFKR